MRFLAWIWDKFFAWWIKPAFWWTAGWFRAFWDTYEKALDPNRPGGPLNRWAAAWLALRAAWDYTIQGALDG